MKNFLMGCFHSGRSGEACPVSEGLGATGVELAIGGGVLAIGGTVCYFVGRHFGKKAEPAKDTPKAA